MSDEWINWSGGECPVDAGAEVECFLQSGAKVKQVAGLLCWRKNIGEATITHYRVPSATKVETKDNPMKIYCDNFLALSKALEDAGGNGLGILQKNHEFLETIARNSVKIDAEYLGGKV